MNILFDNTFNFVVGDINKMIKEIIKLANHLDSIGHKKEADAIDLIFEKFHWMLQPRDQEEGSDPHDTAFRAFSAKINKILMVCLNLKRN